jgi:uncharacterized protein YoxC
MQRGDIDGRTAAFLICAVAFVIFFVFFVIPKNLSDLRQRVVQLEQEIQQLKERR